MELPKLIVSTSDSIRFPRVYAALKWAIIASLTFLAVLAAAFWSLVLGGFAGSGFRAPTPLGAVGESVVITPECAWPYSVNDDDAEAVCRMFYNLTAQQREQVLRTR